MTPQTPASTSSSIYMPPQPSSTPTSPPVASRMDCTRAAIIGSSSFHPAEMRMYSMELSEKFGAHRRPTGVEVLHEQRNIDRAQDTVKITKQIAVPNGELARDRDRYSRRSRVLRDSPQLDPV